MKIRMIGLMLGAAALGVWGAGCEQPTIDCRATRGSFATKFVLQSGSGACSEITTAVIGLQSYYEKGADGLVDITKSSLAIRGGTEVVDYTHFLATADNSDPANPLKACDGAADAVVTHETSEGAFAGVDPNDSSVCEVPNITSSKVVTSEIPGTMDPAYKAACVEGFPAYDITYEWRNVKVFVSTDAPGNRFEADLTYTENGCTAQYKACGVWPVVGCERLDAEGKHTGEPEDKLCDGEPDLEPQYGIPYGSGINTDFKPKCDPDYLICVLPSCPITP